MHKIASLASIDVDSQYCFTPQCPQELPVPEGDLIVEQLNLQANYARLRIGSKDAHSADAIWVANQQHPQGTPLNGNNVDVYWKPHAIPGTQGFKLINGLPHPAEYDFFVWKGIELDMHPYGACYHDLAEKLSTGLIEYLKIQQITLIVVGGLALDYCVKNTALQLAAAGFEVLVNLAATRALAENSAQAAKQAMLIANIKLINSAADLAELTK